MDVQKHFEEKLMRRVVKQSAYIRERGRFPTTLGAVWPTVAVLIFFGILEMVYWLNGWNDRGYMLQVILHVSAVVSIGAMNIRALFFLRIRTGQPLGEGAQRLQVALAAAGFSLVWTEARDAAILFARPGRGASHERHAVVFVPAEGHIWYNVYDPRGANFFVPNRKPLRNLIAGIKDAFSD